MADDPKKPGGKKPSGKPRSSAKKPAKGVKQAAKQPPKAKSSERKQDPEREDILADLDDSIEEPVEYHRGDTTDLDPEGFEEDDLEDVVSAETEEWAAPDPPTGEEELVDDGDTADEPAEEKTLVGAAAVGDSDGEGPGRLSSVLWAFGAPFRSIRRMSWPLWARFATASLLIVASVAAATSASILLYISDVASALKHDGALNALQSKLNQVNPGEPETILLLGSDLRPQGSKASNFRGLSDTTMLVRLDPDRNAIAVFSLPRDLKVEIPGVGVDKLNAAYAYGGPEKTLATLRNLTRSPTLPQGLEVNHVVNIDFEGFARAVNAIDCVYVDVDRRYAHSNANTTDDYEEINLQAGYQALCGFDALDYARYRHTDNDVVRAARQQDFLREARQKVPVSRLVSDRNDLITIFTEHTTSDIANVSDMLQVFELFLDARNKPVKEVHFEGTLGPSFVTASPSEIDKAVNQFLGIEDMPGSPGNSALPGADEPSGQAQAKKDSTGRPASKKGGGGGGGGGGGASTAGLVATSYGKELAKGIRSKKSKVPIFYPTVLEDGSDYAEKPRVYKINGSGKDSPPEGRRAAYKWVFSRPALGEYYGFMGTRWEDPPILKDPTETREFGDRSYDLYYDGDRLRMVAWHQDDSAFWLSNTLITSLNNNEMIAIARGMRELSDGK
ncbi:MAG: hypothetical protein EXQ70_10580 [Solirubrobacterales bacterium]|nr:hypothetical protein [Solirubrobacterales bacterium]